MEIMEQPPETAKSMYEANRKKSSENPENGIPEILHYEDYEMFLQSASKETVDFLLANYIRGY